MMGKPPGRRVRPARREEGFLAGRPRYRLSRLPSNPRRDVGPETFALRCYCRRVLPRCRENCGAGRENRTRVGGLEGRCLATRPDPLNGLGGGKPALRRAHSHHGGWELQPRRPNWLGGAGIAPAGHRRAMTGARPIKVVGSGTIPHLCHIPDIHRSRPRPVALCNRGVVQSGIPTDAGGCHERDPVSEASWAGPGGLGRRVQVRAQFMPGNAGPALDVQHLFSRDVPFFPAQKCAFIHTKKPACPLQGHWRVRRKPELAEGA